MVMLVAEVDEISRPRATAVKGVSNSLQFTLREGFRQAGDRKKPLREVTEHLTIVPAAG
jgi:hypothetical protein